MLIHVVVLAGLAYSVVALVTPGRPRPGSWPTSAASPNIRSLPNPLPRGSRASGSSSTQLAGTSASARAWLLVQGGDRPSRQALRRAPDLDRVFREVDGALSSGRDFLVLQAGRAAGTVLGALGGSERGLDQPSYALARITAGKEDAYITRFAKGIRNQRWPVVLRVDAMRE